MGKATILVAVVVLLGLVGNADATSPMPEEVVPGQKATVCTVYITCLKDRERGTNEELTSTFAFDASEAKEDVLEWVSRYVHDKLGERNVSGFRVECKFPK